MKKSKVNFLIFLIFFSVTPSFICVAVANCVNDGNANYICSGNISGDPYGIEINHTDNTDITFEQLGGSTISGVYDGVTIDNDGNGLLKLAISGGITASSGTGISVRNSENATDLILKQTSESVISAPLGIKVYNYGTGDTNVTLKGITTFLSNSNSGYGLTIQNGMDSNNITVDVYGTINTNNGISLQNNGYGYTSVVIAGNITDVNLLNMTNTGKLTFELTSGSVKGNSSYGIQALNYGSSQTEVTISGDVSGYISGIYINTGLSSGDVVLTQKSGTIFSTLSGNGIDVLNVGTGKSVIDISGNVISKNGSGIFARNMNSATDDVQITQSYGSSISTNLSSGIQVQNYSDTSKTLITISGTVIGGEDSYSGIGIYTTGTSKQEVNITLNDGADVSSATGIAIQDDNGNATVFVNRGAKVSGQILLGTGSDTLTINNGADVTAATLFDGGTASTVTNTTDSDTDVLNINQSLTGSSNSTNNGLAGDILIVNWEQINIGSGNSSDESDTGATLSLSGDLNATSVTTNFNGTISLASSITAATITAEVTNGGNINLSSNGQFGDTLTIKGDYVGNGGNLVLDTLLDDDSSTTDKLVITGSASGTTSVTINNLGGLGAQTVEGIQVIEVDGTSTDTAFTQNGRIVAGSYDYSLTQGNTSGTDKESWYLTSKYIDDTNTKTDTYVIRPETGSYIANLASANTLFNTTLHDRLGETQYTDWLTGEKLVTSMWIRSVVGQNKFEAAGGQLKNKINWSLVQLGGDIAQWTSNDTNRFHLGLMAGYGHNSSDTNARLNGYSSKGKIDGYSLGLYGTWYDNDADKTGLYVDSWVLWNHFNATVHGQELDKEKYKLKGITASVESGYTFKLGESSLYSYWLQPKAQIIYMGVDAGNHTETNGTRVKGDSNNWQSRLGLRFTTSMGNLLAPKPNSTGQFFIEANWLHNTEAFTIKMNNSTISQDGARNIAEIKAGIEGNILTNTNVWFNIGYQRGNHNYSNVNAMLGAKYSF